MTTLRSAEIIAVGTEMLTPHRSDTNSLLLTSRLNELGIDVRLKTIVGDDRAELAALVTQALARADLVILTGGLGPTDDDVTRDAVAAALGLALDEDAEVLATVRERFASRGLPMPEINRRQAQVPRGAVVLANPNGSAPGLWIERGDRRIVLLPGPPREMRPMFDERVAPRLVPLTGGRKWRRREIKVTGRSESQVEEIAYPIYGPLRQAPIPIETTILAKPGQIELHLSAVGADLDAVDRVLDAAVVRLAEALGPVVFSTDDRSLPEVVGHLLRDRHMRIAVAESCTGGMVLGRLTDVPGCSAWVLGGVVAYANAVKLELLGVPADVLKEHGAVSEPVALAMADGVRTRLSADVGLAITGIAGPSGGSTEKPVGTVVVAIAGPRSTARTLRFPGDRNVVRQHSIAAALDLVRRTLLGL